MFGFQSWLRSFFRDAPEYEARARQTHFSPPTVSIKELHAAVPRHLFEKDTFKGLFYVARHLLITYILYCGASQIDSAAFSICGSPCNIALTTSARFLLWCTYWFWQSVAFTGIWSLGELRLFGFFGEAQFVRFTLGHEVRRKNEITFTTSQLCTHRAAMTRYPLFHGSMRSLASDYTPSY